MARSLAVNEILRKVRRIQLVANRAVDDLFAGQYKSVFRGRGMEFDEVREYQPGDDIRTIDWNVTARTGECFIKRFAEERELTVLFLVDISASGAFGSGTQSKLDQLIEISALLMFSALKNNDRVGLVTFGAEVEEFYPPRKGKSHVLHLLRELVAVEAVAQPTRIPRALDFVNRVQRRRAVVFLVSDMLERGDPRSLERSLKLTSRRHDLSVITVTDPRELELPRVGLLSVRDPETGSIRTIDTRRRQTRESFRTASLCSFERRSEMLRRLSIDQLAVDTSGDYLKSLKRFFRMREKRALSGR